MKKILALALALAAPSAYAAISDAGHPHNLMSTPGNTATGACQYCHMPHGAVTGTAGAPIWARALRPATYTQYGTTVAGTTQTTAGSVGTITAACLSCHDGTVNVGTLHNGDTLNGTNDRRVSAATNVGTDISNDHPVSITYSDALPNVAGLKTLASAKTGGFVFFGATSNQLECGSCHDPHGTYNATTTRFLLRGDRALDFCTQCHSAK